MQQTANQPQTWYFKNWGTWGWVETALKLVAIAAAFVALARALTLTNTLQLGGNPHLAAAILLALVALFLLALLPIRIGQREIVTIVFSILAVLGHAALVLAILLNPASRTLPLIFAGLFVAGQLVKFAFLSTTGYTEIGQNARGMQMFNVGFTLIYVVIFVALLA